MTYPEATFLVNLTLTGKVTFYRIKKHDACWQLSELLFGPFRSRLFLRGLWCHFFYIATKGFHALRPVIFLQLVSGPAAHKEMMMVIVARVWGRMVNGWREVEPKPV